MRACELRVCRPTGSRSPHARGLGGDGVRPLASTLAMSTHGLREGSDAVCGRWRRVHPVGTRSGGSGVSARSAGAMVSTVSAGTRRPSVLRRPSAARASASSSRAFSA